MKPKVVTTTIREFSDAARQMSCELKELQGSFKIEGIDISDDRALRYESEFQKAKKSGQARANIDRAIRDISES